MSSVFRHPYHLVDSSPWPLYTSFFLAFSIFGLLGCVKNPSTFTILSGPPAQNMFIVPETLLTAIGVMGTCFVSFQWWKDVSKEATFQGRHTGAVELGMRWGMCLFILSEVMFFSSFFWAFFHSSLAPTGSLGASWPPLGICSFDPFSVPLLNTLVLLSSGVSITWSHHSFMAGEDSSALDGILITVFLGIYFTFLQGVEYKEALFSLNDSVYGSVFFIGTGFHGFHVIVGTLFLGVTFLRGSKGHFSAIHHFGLEAAAWYWHFVDVVWLFLYFWFYWWSSL